MEPENNEQMSKLGASDMCHLHVANSELRLLCAKDGRLLVAWPFTCLRRYMSTRGKFTVEAGRRAPTGEGKFTFLTPQHDEIYKLLDHVIKSRAGQTSTTKSHQPPEQTKSVPTDERRDVPQNGYDNAVATSPRKDEQMMAGSSDSMNNAYASPYGHLPPRDTGKKASPILIRRTPQAVPDSRLIADSDVSEEYNTLSHPVQGFEKKGSKGVVETEYCILDQCLSPPTEGQDMYNTTQHHGKFQKPAASQYSVTEDVYNVLGETLPHMVHNESRGNEENAYNTLDMTKNQTSSTSSQLEQTYNTLDHAAPARPPRKPIQPLPRTRPPAAKSSPKSPARKLSSDLASNLQSSPADINDNTYNTLGVNSRAPPSLVRRVPDEADDNTYNTLETSNQRQPPPIPVRKTPDQLLKKHLKSQQSFDENSDMYNTLDHTKVRHQSPVTARKTHFQTFSGEGSEVYNTLDADKRVAANPIPPSRVTKQSSQSADDDGMYSTLDSSRGGAVKSPIHNEKLDNVQSRNDQMDDMYNTLDSTRTGASVPPPVPTQRTSVSSIAGSPLRSPIKKVADAPTLRKNFASSLQSFHCSLDDDNALQPGVPQKSSSLDDLDSYASIDYTMVCQPKGTQGQYPIPAQRAANIKGVPFKGRKSSAPDIISLAKTNNTGKNSKKGGKSGLVLNLKASLEAGGLDFSKPRRKPKNKLSREDSSGDLPTHSEVEEHGVTPTEEVFSPGTPPIKPGRSSSSPADPNKEDVVYDELNQPELRPKSLQITKPKRSPKKS